MSIVDDFKTLQGGLILINSGAIVGIMAYVRSLDTRLKDMEAENKKLSSLNNELAKNLVKIQKSLSKTHETAEEAKLGISEIEKRVDDIAESSEKSSSEVMGRLEEMTDMLESMGCDFDSDQPKKKKKKQFQGWSGKQERQERRPVRKQNQLPLSMRDDVEDIVGEILGD